MIKTIISKTLIIIIFLNYCLSLFRQRKNIVLSNSQKSSHVLLVFSSNAALSEEQISKHTENRSCDYTNLFLSTKDWRTKACSSFSNHGHCISGKKCKESHDIDLVVLSKEVDVTKNERKRKRDVMEKLKNSPSSQQDFQDQQPWSNVDVNDLPSTNVEEKEKTSELQKSEQIPNTSDTSKPKSNKESSSDTGFVSDSNQDPLLKPPKPPKPEKPRKNPKKSNCDGHRAGFDAFMTGYSFATFIAHSALIRPEDGAKSEAISRFLGVPVKPEYSDLNIANRIYLVCKDIPFMVRKSAYSKNSLGHCGKYTKEYTRNWVENS